MKKILLLLAILFMSVGVANATGWHSGNHLESYDGCTKTEVTFDKAESEGPCGAYLSDHEMPQKHDSSMYGGKPVHEKKQEKSLVISIEQRDNMDTFKPNLAKCDGCDGHYEQESMPTKTGESFGAGNAIVNFIKSCFVN